MHKSELYNVVVNTNYSMGRERRCMIKELLNKYKNIAHAVIEFFEFIRTLSIKAKINIKNK